MPGKSFAVMLWVAGSKIIQKKKRIELPYFTETESPLEMHPCPFNGLLAFEDLFNSPCCIHGNIRTI
jgi:hypothetical protein